jgi:hypothetical protein
MRRLLFSLRRVVRYRGHGTAEFRSTVSSGKLNAPSIAFDVAPISGMNPAGCIKLQPMQVAAQFLKQWICV